MGIHEALFHFHGDFWCRMQYHLNPQFSKLLTPKRPQQLWHVSEFASCI